MEVKMMSKYGAKKNVKKYGAKNNVKVWNYVDPKSVTMFCKFGQRNCEAHCTLRQCNCTPK